MIWVVLACVPAALILVSLVRVGLCAEYDGRQLAVRFRIGAMTLQLYPLKKAKKAAKKNTRKKMPQRRVEPELKGGEKISLLQTLLPVALRAAGSLRKKISVDHLEFYALLGGGDPASVAVAFGGVNAIIGMVLPLLEQNFHIRQHDIRTGVDFQGRQTEIKAKVALSLTVGQGVAFALRFGSQALGVLIHWRRQNRCEQVKKQMTERAVSYGKEPSNQ